MSRLSEKLTQAASAAKETMVELEAQADAVIHRRLSLKKRTAEVFAPHNEHLDEAEKGLDEVERALGQISNS